MSNIFDGNSFSDKYYVLLRDFLIENKLNNIFLKVILANDNPSSKLYVSIKDRIGKYIGINIKIIRLGVSTSESELIKIINDENNNKTTDGIIVQLPIFKTISSQAVTESIIHTKDVDGLTSNNLGKLILSDKMGFVPCTALAVLKVLKDNDIKTSGKTVLVLGRSNLVGRPLSILLSSSPYDSTVITCHSKSTYLDIYTRQADIIVSAVGKPKFINANMISRNPYIIDIGISKVKMGHKIFFFGDTDFENIKDKVKFITPVKGGIGPVTVLMLMYNTIKSHLINNSRLDLLKKLEKLMEV